MVTAAPPRDMTKGAQLLGRGLAALRGASPVICFFLASFGLIYWLFGLQYVMVVSVVTVFFQGWHKKGGTSLGRYLRLLIIGSLLNLLAYCSASGLAACILLNLTVPFVLVLTQSSQFNPKGYFSYAMIFVFLSLIPPAGWRELGIQLVAFGLCVGLLAAALALYSRLARPNAMPLTLARILRELADLIPLLTRSEGQKELEARFFRLLEQVHQLSYHQKVFITHSRDNQIHDMASTLVQRVSYMVADHEWREELDPARIRALEELAAFLNETAGCLEGPQQKAQVARARQLLEEMDLPEGRVRIFCRSQLHMLVLLLTTLNQPPAPNRLLPPIRGRDLLYRLARRCSLESFEMRFAMRMSITMTASFVLSYLLPVTHSYWIPLNAFLLLQPSCEESSYRMMTRPVGTVIGCCVEFFAYGLLDGMGARLVFALVMISFMYCATPGTWYQPIFSNCYALTLAAMTMNETTAITLRLLYLGVALLVVFVVNRFFFPIRQKTQFQRNFKALFRLHNDYWDILRQGLVQITSLTVSCEILTHFHTLYQACNAYLARIPNDPQSEPMRQVLLTLWHMFSELEQLHYLVRTGRVAPEEGRALESLIAAIQRQLYPIISYEDLATLARDLPYADADVIYVLREYIAHAESLLQYQQVIPF